MYRNTVVIILVLLLFSLPIAIAEESPDIKSKRQPDSPVMPHGLASFEGVVRDAVGLKNDLNEPINEISLTRYDESGRINQVIYQDGKSVDYLYGFDEAGILSSVTQRIGDKAVITYTKSVPKEYIESGNFILWSYNAETKNFELSKNKAMDLSNDSAYYAMLDSDTDDPDNPIIIIEIDTEDNINPADSLEQIAHAPPFIPPFSEIDDAVEEISKAHIDYLSKIEAYYDKVYEELKVVPDAQKDSDYGAAEVEEIKKKAMTDSDKRAFVDAAVQDVYSQNEKAGVEDIAIRNFIEKEVKYREEFLSSGKEIYDGRVKKAIEYLNGVIDDLLTSHLAMYLNIKKDKIKAVIKLPKRDKK